MRPARELFKGGRVSEVKCEPPLLSGYVRKGAKNYRSGVRIKTHSTAENEIEPQPIAAGALRGITRVAGVPLANWSSSRDGITGRSRTFSEFVEASLGLDVRPGKWRELGNREMDHPIRAARMSERDAIESSRPLADRHSEDKISAFGAIRDSRIATRQSVGKAD